MLNTLLNVSKLFILFAVMVTLLVIYKPVSIDIPVFIGCHVVSLPSGIYQKYSPESVPFKRGMNNLYLFLFLSIEPPCARPYFGKTTTQDIRDLFT